MEIQTKCCNNSYIFANLSNFHGLIGILFIKLDIGSDTCYLRDVHPPQFGIVAVGL